MLYNADEIILYALRQDMISINTLINSSLVLFTSVKDIRVNEKDYVRYEIYMHPYIWNIVNLIFKTLLFTIKIILLYFISKIFVFILDLLLLSLGMPVISSFTLGLYNSYIGQDQSQVLIPIDQESSIDLIDTSENKTNFMIFLLLIGCFAGYLFFDDYTRNSLFIPFLLTKCTKISESIKNIFINYYSRLAAKLTLEVVFKFIIAEIIFYQVMLILTPLLTIPVYYFLTFFSPTIRFIYENSPSFLIDLLLNIIQCYSMYLNLLNDIFYYMSEVGLNYGMLAFYPFMSMLPFFITVRSMSTKSTRKTPIQKNMVKY